MKIQVAKENEYLQRDFLPEFKIGKNSCVGERDVLEILPLIHLFIRWCVPALLQGLCWALGRPVGRCRVSQGCIEVTFRVEEGHLTQTGNATKGSWEVVFQKEHQASGAEAIIEQGYPVPPIYVQITLSSFVMYKGTKISEEHEKLQAGFGAHYILGLKHALYIQASSFETVGVQQKGLQSQLHYVRMV